MNELLLGCRETASEVEQLNYPAFVSCVSTHPASPNHQRSPVGERLPQNPLWFLPGCSLLHAEVPLLVSAAPAIWVLRTRLS